MDLLFRFTVWLGRPPAFWWGVHVRRMLLKLCVYAHKGFSSSPVFIPVEVNSATVWEKVTVNNEYRLFACEVFNYIYKSHKSIPLRYFSRLRRANLHNSSEGSTNAIYRTPDVIVNKKKNQCRVQFDRSAPRLHYEFTPSRNVRA